MYMLCLCVYVLGLCMFLCITAHEIQGQDELRKYSIT